MMFFMVSKGYYIMYARAYMDTARHKIQDGYLCNALATLCFFIVLYEFKRLFALVFYVRKCVTA